MTAEPSIYAWLGPRVVLPLYERLGGHRFWSECLRLKALQRQTPAELETRAVRKLRALVAHAAARIPFEGRRLGEAIRTPGGRIVTAPPLDGVFRSAAPYVREFQAVQTAADTITLRIVPTAAFTPEIATQLRTTLERYAGADVRVRVEPVARIAPEPSGKRLVVKAYVDRS